MTVRVNKPSFNIREKLSELGRKFGLKGSELAAAETVQEARDLVSAGRKNLIINGDMRLAQRATSATASNDTYNTVDRFNTWIDYSSGTHLMSQESDAPPGFSKSVKYTSSATGANYHIFQQNIEANNLGHINAGTNDALPLTMSFWVKSNRPSTYNFEIINDAGSYHIVKQYTIKQSGVWEHKVIHIPPQTVGGAMTVDNTSGYYLYWWLGSNSNYNGTALTDNWVTYSTPRRNEGGNATLDSGEYWMITGIQLEVGSNATEFEHRSYGEELALCQRYYCKSYKPYQSPGAGTSDGLQVIRNYDASNSRSDHPAGVQFPVTMRDVPNITLYSQNGTANRYTVGNTTAGSFVNQGGTVSNILLKGTGSIGAISFSTTVPAAAFAYFHYTAESEL